MVDPDDPHNYQGKLDSGLQQLAEADIADSDRTAIRQYIEAANQELSDGTLANRVTRLRLAAERIDGALTEAELEDVTSLLFALDREYDLSEGTIRNYRKALRVFYRHQDREWAEEIHIGASPDRTVGPDDLLSQDDIDALFDATNNARDRALLALLLDTGLRIGAVASLRVGDVSLSAEAGQVTIPEDGQATKGASGTVPITWAKPYVANWLEVHPRREDDAPLIAFLKDSDESEGVTYQHLHRHLGRLADRAGLDPDAITPHTFRKTAISRWIRDGFSEQEIKHRACWVKDSSQFEVYSGVRDTELNAQILEHYGLGDATSGGPTRKTCPQCAVALSGEPAFCPACGAELTSEASTAADAVDQEAIKALTDRPELAEAIVGLKDAVDEDPALLAALTDTSD